MKKNILVVMLIIISGKINANDLCPNEIQTIQKLQNVSPDYEVSFDGVANALKVVEFFYGHPSEMSSLAPDEDENKGKEQKFSWEFENPEKIYYVCKYTNTNVVLIRKLKSYKKCIITYDTTKKLYGGSYAYKNQICN